MGTDLCLITNSKLTGREKKDDWMEIVQKLKDLKIETYTFYAAKEEIIKAEGDWDFEVNLEEEDLPFNVDFYGPFPISPVTLYSNIGLMYTIYRYRTLYEIYEDKEWFNQFRTDLYNIVKIIGGTEVIYLADNGTDKLGAITQGMVWENVPYEDVKKELLKMFGNPITDYSKLDFESLNYYNIKEFFLDDFSDFKENKH